VSEKKIGLKKKDKKAKFEVWIIMEDKDERVYYSWKLDNEPIIVISLLMIFKDVGLEDHT